MRHTGVRKQGVLVGAGDGAPWVQGQFDTLGVKQHIFDVYHAPLYLEKVLLAMAWPEAKQETERRLWLRGEANARTWFSAHLPSPQMCSQWSAEAKGALRYLQQRLDTMDYRDYKAMGRPIGSGQTEGTNLEC